MSIPANFGNKKLCEYEISLRYKSINNGQMILNQYLSKLIIDKKLSKVQLRTDNDKLFMFFNSNTGYNLSYSTKKKNVAICTVQPLKKILTTFNSLKLGAYRIHVSKNLSSEESCVTVQILKLYGLGTSLESDEESAKEQPTVASTVSTPNISTCIQILKEAGYVILAPRTHYIEI